jgi:hypothetical protein
MPIGIDHLVIAVPDLAAAAAEVTEKVGLAFTAGGRHAGLGSFNRIAFLGDFYLELMGVDDRAAAERWPIGAAAVRALEGGGGFATWALADPVIRVTVARLRANGSHIGPVTYGSRERPDGERVEWWSASPPELGPDRPPLLIKHLEAGAEWGAEALPARRAFVHPIGSPVRLDGLDLAVGDPLALAATCNAEIGLDFAWGGAAAVATVGRQAIRLTRGTAAEATIRIAAAVGAARSARLLGVRFVVRPSRPV